MGIACLPPVLPGGWFVAQAGSQGRVVQLYGRGFSFQVSEPEGWILDTRAAPQIANFIFYPRGTDWRRARVLVVARFIPREASETLDSFREKNSRQFGESCPFGEEALGGVDGLNDDTAFEVRTFECPGIRKELVASARFPGYFVVFALSAPNEEGLDEGRSAFREIVNSFLWVDRSGAVPLNPDGGDQPGTLR